jgi:hypothetical protein
METLLYAHLPGLAGLESSVEFNGGQVGLISYETYLRLDVDRANQLHFEHNKPVFWQAAAPAAFCSSLTESTRYASDIAQLFFLALIAGTGRIIPDPQLSICYAHSEGLGLESMIGPAGRNLILHGNVLPPFDSSQLVQAAKIAESWLGFGLSPQSSIFDCLRAWGGSAYVEPHPIVGLLPLMVALEGLLVGRQVQGIVKHMLKAVGKLCGPEISERYSGIIYKAYDCRSRLVHGRKISDVTDASLVFEELRRLTGTIVRAAIEDGKRAQVTAQQLFDHVQRKVANDG